MTHYTSPIREHVVLRDLSQPTPTNLIGRWEKIDSKYTFLIYCPFLLVRVSITTETSFLMKVFLIYEFFCE